MESEITLRRWGRSWAVVLSYVAASAGAIAAEPTDISINSDKIIVEEQLISGKGAVKIVVGETHFEVAGFEWDTHAQQLRCAAGRLIEKNRGVVEFVSASWHNGIVELDEANWTDVQLGIAARAEQLRFTEDGKTEARSLVLECLCEGVSPWIIRGNHVRWDSSRELMIRGGRIGVFGKPFVPIPAMTVPLSRRSGLLIPELGYGIDGFRVKSPVYLTLGRSADLTLTPELRTGRSVRVLSESRFATHQGEGTVHVDGGYDWQEQRVRGAGRWQLRWYDQRLNVASTGQLIGDSTYLNDFGDRYLVRQTPWTESRLLMGAGQVELASSLVQFDQETQQEVTMVAARLPSTEAPWGMLMDGAIEGALVGVSQQPWTIRQAMFSGRTRFALERPMRIGPLMVKPRVMGATIGDNRGVSGLGFGELDLRLLGWSNSLGYLRFEPSVQIESGIGASDYGAAIRPSILVRRVTPAGALIESMVALRYSTQGVDADGWAAVDTPGMRWWIQGIVGSVRGREFGSAINLRRDRSGVNLLWLWQQRDASNLPFHQGSVVGQLGLPGPLEAIRIGAGVGMDFVTDGVVRRQLSVEYIHPSGCLDVGVRGWLDEDRGWPDLALTLAIAPGQQRSLPTPLLQPR